MFRWHSSNRGSCERQRRLYICQVASHATIYMDSGNDRSNCRVDRVEVTTVSRKSSTRRRKLLWSPRSVVEMYVTGLCVECETQHSLLTRTEPDRHCTSPTITRSPVGTVTDVTKKISDTSWWTVTSGPVYSERMDNPPLPGNSQR